MIAGEDLKAGAEVRIDEQGRVVAQHPDRAETWRLVLVAACREVGSHAMRWNGEQFPYGWTSSPLPEAHHVLRALFEAAHKDLGK